MNPAQRKKLEKLIEDECSDAIIDVLEHMEYGKLTKFLDDPRMFLYWAMVYALADLVRLGRFIVIRRGVEGRK